MRIRKGSWIAGLLAAVLILAAAPARPPLESVLDALEQVRSFRSVDISPDGTRVAWVQRLRSRDGAEVLSTIDIAEIASPSTRRVTAPKDARAHREQNAVWSPDGKRLAFLSDAAREKQLQIYVAPASGGPPRRLTGVSGQVGHPKWSPDG